MQWRDNSRNVQVALRKESVDRNKYVVQCRKTLGVALRKESVDRNIRTARESSDNKRVALRKESVDRNVNPMISLDTCGLSLSARRAWIEISALDGESAAGAGRSPQGERG